MEDKVQQRAVPAWAPFALRIVMVVAAVGLVAAFFLPWASANEEFREAAAAMPEAMFFEPTGLTAEGAVDLSLMEYAQVYGSMDGAWQIYMVIMYATLAVSVLSLVLAAWGKPVGVVIFVVLALAASRLLVWDFGDRGVLPNTSHDWGVAATIYLVAAAVLIVAGIAAAVLKHQQKTAAKA